MDSVKTLTPPPDERVDTRMYLFLDRDSENVLSNLGVLEESIKKQEGIKKTIILELNISQYTGIDEAISGVKNKVEKGKGVFKVIGNEDLLSSALVFDVWGEKNFAEIVELMKKNLDAMDFGEIIHSTKKNLDAINLDLPPGQVTMSFIDKECIIILVRTREEIPYWVVTFHNPLNDGVVLDYAHNLLQLSMCTHLLGREKQKLIYLEKMMLERIDIVHEFGQDSNVNHTYKTFINLAEFRKELIRIKTNTELIIRHKRLLNTWLSEHLEKAILEERGIYRKLLAEIDDMERDVRLSLNNFSSNISTMREIVDDLIWTRSVEVGEKGVELTEASHSIHAGMFVLEFVLFAEIILSLIETFPIYEHGSMLVKLGFAIVSLMLGITSALVLTRLASTKHLSKIIFGTRR